MKPQALSSVCSNQRVPVFFEVTIGIFNLIMAVFIDNVTDGSTKKRQRQLGQNAPKTEFVAWKEIRSGDTRGLFLVKQGKQYWPQICLKKTCSSRWFPWAKLHLPDHLQLQADSRPGISLNISEFQDAFQHACYSCSTICSIGQHSMFCLFETWSCGPAKVIASTLRHMILTNLFKKEATRKGRIVSMSDASFSSLSNHAGHISYAGCIAKNKHLDSTPQGLCQQFILWLPWG